MTTPQTIDERRGATSASNAEADSLCAGRHLAQAGLPDTEKSEDAERGDRIHAALAAPPGDENGTERTARINALSLEERDMFDMCREDEKKLIAQYFGASYPPMKVFREVRRWVKVPGPNGSGPFEHSAKPDVVYRAGTKVLVIEYKTGRIEVEESPANLQLRDQAVLTRGALVTIDEAGCAVVQPWVTREPKLCVYSRDDLLRAEQEMFSRVIRSSTPGQPRVAGEVQCKFCRAKGGCVEYQKWAGGGLLPAVIALDVPMQSWTAEQRSRAAEALSPCQKFLDELKSFLKSDPPPGWTLGKGRNVESITDAQKAFERFAALGGNLEQFMPVVKVQKTKLEEAVNLVTGAKGKALKNVMATLTEGIVQTSTTEGSLVKVKEAAK